MPLAPNGARYGHVTSYLVVVTIHRLRVGMRAVPPGAELPPSKCHVVNGPPCTYQHGHWTFYSPFKTLRCPASYYSD